MAQEETVRTASGKQLFIPAVQILSLNAAEAALDESLLRELEDFRTKDDGCTDDRTGK